MQRTRISRALHLLLLAALLTTLIAPTAAVPTVADGEEAGLELSPSWSLPSSLLVLAWSPDDSMLAVGTSTSLEVFDATDGASMWKKDYLGVVVTGVSWSPDGSMLAASFTGTGEGGLLVYTVDGNLEYNLSVVDEFSVSSVGGVAWSPSGDVIAVNTVCGVVVFDSSFQSSWDNGCGYDYVFDMAWRPDGSMLAVAMGSNVYVYTSNGELSWQASIGDNDNALVVEWSPDGSMLAVGTSYPGKVYVFTATGSQVSVSEEMDGAVDTISWSPAGDMIVAATGSDGVYVITASSGSTDFISLPGIMAGAVDWSAGNLIVVAMHEQVVTLAPDGQIVWQDDIGRSVVLTEWSRDGSKLAVTSMGSAYVYSSQGTLLWRIDYLEGNIVDALDWSWDASKLAVGTGYPDYLVYTFTGEGELLWTVGGFDGGVECIDWSPDGGFLAVGTVYPGHSLYVLTGDGRIAWQDDLASNVLEVEWSPDGVYVAAMTGYPQSSVYVYTQDGQLVWSYSTDNEVLESIAWSPDGAKLAVSTESGSLHIFTTDTWAEESMFTLGDPVHHIAWNPQGDTIAGASWSSLEAIDASTGSIKWVKNLPGYANGLTWSPDGSMIGVVTEEYSFVYVVDAATGADIYSSPLSDSGRAISWTSHGDSEMIAVGGYFGLIVLSTTPAPGGEVPDNQTGTTSDNTTGDEGVSYPAGDETPGTQETETPPSGEGEPGTNETPATSGGGEEGTTGAGSWTTSILESENGRLLLLGLIVVLIIVVAVARKR